MSQHKQSIRDNSPCSPLHQLKPLTTRPSHQSSFPPSATFFRSNVLQFYKIFHNLYYHLFLIPFKIEGVSPSSEITLRESRVRDVICYTLHFLHFLFAIPPLILAPFYKKIRSGSQFYEILTLVTYFFFDAACSLFCVRKSKTISLIQKLTSIWDQKGQRCSRRSRSHRWSLGLCYGFILISFSVAVTYFITNHWERFSSPSFQDFISSWTDAASKHFQLAEMEMEAQSNVNGTAWGWDGVHYSGKVVIAFSQLFLEVLNYLILYLAGLLVFVDCLIVYELGQDFMATFDDPHENRHAVAVDGLGECKTIRLEELKGCHEELWVVLDAMNNSFGEIVLTFFLTTVPWFSLYFITFSSGGTDLMQALDTFVASMIYGTSLYLAAEGHRQEFSGFIYKNRRLISVGGVRGVNDENQILTFLAHVMDTEGKCGVRGGRFFTISYNFVASALILMSTHIITMLQFATTETT